jgi:UDP-galactopyranose mutase
VDRWFDVIVVGVGFAGSVLAQKLAKNNKKVLILEKRPHIGGNCYDSYDINGVLIHNYGPHLFHTDSKKVWDYLSSFTSWHPYEHKVKAYIDEKFVPIPFNFNTLQKLFPYQKAKRLEEKLLENFAYGEKIPILELQKSDDEDLKFLSDYIYDKVFKNYTAKQWGIKIEDLDKEVSSRVPVVLSKDDRYFHDKFQAIPKNGYTELFKNLLQDENITVKLDCDYRNVLKLKDREFFFEGEIFKGEVVFTAMLDELFNYSLGKLPYRSLDLVFETYDKEEYQCATTINYPNDYDFTRITEFKKILSQKLPKTTILKEFPKAYNDKNGDIAYYPIFTKENQNLYNRYADMAKEIPNLTIIGRLAEYKYYDMDDIVLKALEVYEEKFDG